MKRENWRSANIKRSWSNVASGILWESSHKNWIDYDFMNDQSFYLWTLWLCDAGPLLCAQCTPFSIRARTYQQHQPIIINNVNVTIAPEIWMAAGCWLRWLINNANMHSSLKQFHLIHQFHVHLFQRLNHYTYKVTLFSIQMMRKYRIFRLLILNLHES